MIKVDVGASGEQDSRQAGAAGAELALTKAGLKKADFAFVFSTIGHDHENLLQGVKSIMKNTAFIGCSCGGLIGQEGIQDESKAVSVMAIASDEMNFLPVFAKGLKDNSFGAGRGFCAKQGRWPRMLWRSSAISGRSLFCSLIAWDGAEKLWERR